MPTIPQRTLAPRRNEGQHSANVVADTPPASPPAPTLRRAAAFPAAPARALNPPVITIATVNGIAPRSGSATPSSPSPVLDNDIADLPPEELARFLAELNLGTRPPRRVYDTEDVLFHALHRNAVSMSPAAPPPATPAASTAPPPLPATPTALPLPPATPAVPLLSPATIYYEDGAPAALRAWRKQNRRDLLYVVAKGRQIGIFDSWFVVRDQVSGFSGNSYRSFADWQSAWQRWCEVNLQGRTSGPLHRLSMVGVVRSRAVEGAPPAYTENV